MINCDLTDEVHDVLRITTDRRIQPLPVLLNNELRGIVSMGDLIKARISELEADRTYP